jgi:hypothetical protein
MPSFSRSIRLRCAVAALLLSSLACATAAAPPLPREAPLASGEFVASSMNDKFFATLGEFRGRYLVYRDSVVLNDVVATLVLVDRSSYRGPRELESIVASIAEYTGEVRHDVPVWRRTSRSRALELTGVMKPGDRRTIDRLIFSIPVSDPRQLSQRWIVFSTYTRTPGSSSGSAHAHSDEKIFAQLRLP